MPRGLIRVLSNPEVAVSLFLLAALVYKVRLMRPVATGPIGPAVVRHDAAIAALLLTL